jgi:hypothetical protein
LVRGMPPAKTPRSPQARLEHQVAEASQFA